VQQGHGIGAAAHADNDFVAGTEQLMLRYICQNVGNHRKKKEHAIAAFLFLLL
jgi:hypothetical protein